MSASALSLERAPRGAFLARRALALAALAALLAAAYAFWFRDSALVAVRTVEVEGVPASVPGAGELERALADAGERMTTLHVREELLREAARPFPLVGSVSADPSFPSGLTIRVRLRRPAAIAGIDGDEVAIAGDGTVLRGLPLENAGDLPRLSLAGQPERARVTGPDLEQARVLGAAPASMLGYVEESFADSSGVGARLEGGVELRFGTPARAVEKWRAAAAVLSDPALGPLDYVDLSAPRRPAVGGISYSPPPLAGA
jgi:cell division protein FtsQ